MPETSLLSSLSQGFDTVVRDPVWGDIRFDETLFALAQSPSFSLLDGIRQLGPAALLYPGATHTRKMHSLGVYHIARRLALSLVERGQLPFATGEGLRSFLAAALCHDLGHYPYAHSLKELPLKPHEALAGELVLAEPLRSFILDCGADPAAVAAIIDRGRPVPEGGETLLFRNILSGALDPDKIDYLTRDAYYCGVPYGVQDADFMLRRVLVGKEGLSVDERGEMSVEALLFSKYQMYRAVYWHPSLRSATSMVKKTLLSGLKAGDIAPENLYGLSDAGFERLMREGKGLSFSPAREVFEGRLYGLAYEAPYRSANAIHRDLDDLTKRLEAEAGLAMAAGLEENDIVIDIPEPIDFETRLAVKTKEGSKAFSERSLLFSAGTIKDLALSLRRIRVFARRRTEKPSLIGLAKELLG